MTVSFLLSYMGRPMQLFAWRGWPVGALVSWCALYLALFKIFTGADIGNRPLLSLAILLMILGAQFLVMGLLGELQARTYYEVQEKPVYAIRTEE